MSDNPKEGEIFPPTDSARRTQGAVPARPMVDRMPAENPGGVVGSAVTRLVASLRRKANNALATDAHARADYFDAVGRAAKSFIGMNQAISEVSELDEILGLDRNERRANRAEHEAEIKHRKQVAELRRKQEATEAERGVFNAEQGYENQKLLKELNLEIWQKRKEAEHLDAAAMAEHLRGEAGRDLKKGEGGLLNELQAQADKLEKEILEAKADGKDPVGDYMALSELRALIERLGGQSK